MRILASKIWMHESSGFDGMIEWLYEPRDMWFGFFWKKEGKFRNEFSFEIYICIVPCLPIHVEFGRV